MCWWLRALLGQRQILYDAAALRRRRWLEPRRRVVAGAGWNRGRDSGVLVVRAPASLDAAGAGHVEEPSGRRQIRCERVSGGV
jgi:hypothetical protein